MANLLHDLLPWLLEPDEANPGVRYFALRQLLDRPQDDAEVVEAQAAVMQTGPVPVILAEQQQDGYWYKPGPGYASKYRGTTWQVVHLYRLGADPVDRGVRAGCEYVLSNTQALSGGFGFSGRAVGPPPPSSVAHCLNGNLLAALINFGWLDDSRVQRAIQWQALSITGEEPGVPYYKSTTSGPGFACGVNLGQPCGWGANKAIAALNSIPPDRRDEQVESALSIGADFLLSRDPRQRGLPLHGTRQQHLVSLRPAALLLERRA